MADNKFRPLPKVKREADKVKAVYSLGSGYQVKVVADLLDLDEQTVRQYFLDYKNRNKKDRNKKQWVQLHYSGKEPSLTNEQEQELIKHLDENLYQRSQDIILYIKKRYKVHYSSSGVKKLLHRLNFSYKKPKAVPGKFDNHLQDLFLRKYCRILKTRGENDVVLFGDAMHPAYQMAASYSPNLNLIERLWKFFNEKVRNNRYYASFKQFTEACKSFFRCRKRWTEELLSRITQNFQRIKNQCFKGDSKNLPTKKKKSLIFNV